MAYDAIMLLVYTWEEAWHVFKRQYRYVESVAEPDETRSLNRGVDVKSPGVDLWLVSHHPYGISVQSSKARYDVSRMVRLHLEKFPAIHYSYDYFLHIVRLVRIVRQYAVQVLALTHGWPRLCSGRVLHVVGG